MSALYGCLWTAWRPVTHGQMARSRNGYAATALTDSAKASSSASLKRFDCLCCFFEAWLLRGVDEAREEAPAPKLPEAPLRRWP